MILKRLCDALNTIKTLKLVDETLFVTDLRQIFDLPETENYVQFVNNYEAEHESRFNEKLLKTPAVENNVWKQPLFDDRHIFCRFAIHGFHNQICSKSSKKVFEEKNAPNSTSPSAKNGSFPLKRTPKLPTKPKNSQRIMTANNILCFRF